ncbi:porin [Psychrosphaera sp. B3R10]|uniref:porin n=1 Tax=unclassified Psychrosphaera TaxID=2641570 RepID=UPI001C08B83D|nr:MULTISPECIES: porin [unclassified Psychrosphaera]MBU2882924.1 porin [Psychrosphaera sp. I2R16]MBU2991321.1 porin [Psychrosphaera sp. B3R10]
MKILRPIIAVAALSALTNSAFAAQFTTDVYGKVNVTVQNSDGETELKSNSSRFGLKGSEKLKGGLEVFYKYEIQVDVADESTTENLKSRNQYIGLKGSFGEVILGRNDTVLKQSQGKFDLFSDLTADIKNVGWKGENRINDSVTYKTPKVNGFQFGASYYIDEENDDSATSLSVTYGDSALKKGKYYAAVAMDNELNGYNVTRLTGGTKVGSVKLGAMFQTQESVDTGIEKDGFMVSAEYLMGAYNLKGQYQTLEDDSGFTVGADRKLGKNTKAFAFYTTFGSDDDASGSNKNYLGLGLEQKF